MADAAAPAKPLTRRELRERERALELAAGEEPATAVLPIVAEVPARTAVIPVIASGIPAAPQQEPHTAESYSELLNSLVLPPPEPAPLATVEDFMHAAAPAAFSAPAKSAEEPALRRARRAASVEFDTVPAMDPSEAPSARRDARTRDAAEPHGTGSIDTGSTGTGPISTGPISVGTVGEDAQPVSTVRLDALLAGTLRAEPVLGTPTVSPAQRRRTFTAGGQAEPQSAPRSTAASSSTRSRTRRIATKTSAMFAMGFVALMAVATSVPAEALLTADDVKAAAQIAKMPSTTEPGQSVIASGSDSITVQTDGYETATIAEAAAASGIRMEATFDNNPNGSVQWPFAVGVHVGDRFGYRDCAGCSSNHGGQDFNPGNGAEIQAIADGVVTLAEDGEGSLGVHMMIQHEINGETITSVYAHMQHGTMRYSTGDTVKVGSVIGNTGTTGMSTGPHLHFEIRLGGIGGTKVDPLDWLYANTN